MPRLLPMAELRYMQHADFPQMVRLLLDRGDNINVKYNDGFTALQLVCAKSNDIEMARFFYIGADICAGEENDSLNPLFIAFHENKKEFQQLLIQLKLELANSVLQFLELEALLGKMPLQQNLVLSLKNGGLSWIKWLFLRNRAESN